MDLRLFSIEQAPKSLPVWETILQDLGAPSAPRIARALDVGTSTVYRWNQTGSAPRVACLALFWLTRWGRSEIDARATNDAMTAVALARSLSDERNALRGRVTLLAEERDRLSQVVQRFQALADRGSAATADRSRTDTAREDSSALEWPALEPQPLPWPALPPLPALLTPSDGGPGSPAVPQPAAHSARSPARPRSGPPLPSSLPEASPSSPFAPPCYHNDATMPPLDGGRVSVVELTTSPGATAAAARPAGGSRHPAGQAAADGYAGQSPSADADAGLRPADVLAAQAANAQWPSWRAGTAKADRAPTPRAPTAPGPAHKGLTVEARRLPPTVLGASPQPPAALGAAGRGVFEAMADALAPARHHPGSRWPAESERLDEPSSTSS